MCLIQPTHWFISRKKTFGCWLQILSAKLSLHSTTFSPLQYSDSLQYRGHINRVPHSLSRISSCYSWLEPAEAPWFLGNIWHDFSQEGWGKKAQSDSYNEQVCVGNAYVNNVCVLVKCTQVDYMTRYIGKLKFQNTSTWYQNVSTSKLAFMFFLHDVTLLSQILKVTPSSNNDCTGVTHRQSVCVSTLSSKCQVHPCSWSHEMLVINGFWEREKKDYSYDLWHIFNLSSHLSGFMLLLTFQE